MMGLNVLLCDDEPEAVSKFSTLIESCARKQQVNIELKCFPSGESLLYEFIESGLNIDILYLDIVMKKIDGMETAKKLRAAGCGSPIIFLSSCEDYVYDAFDVDAVQYLVKDRFTEEKFEQIFRKSAERAREPEQPVFVCEFSGVKTFIPIAEITYFEIWRRLVTVHYGGKTKKFYGNMERLEQEFKAKYFVRCHRSYLIHLPYIAEFHRTQIVLKCGTCIPVGATHYNELCTAFSKYVIQMREKRSGEKLCYM